MQNGHTLSLNYKGKPKHYPCVNNLIADFPFPEALTRVRGFFGCYFLSMQMKRYNMTKRYPLKRKVCDHCGATHYSRSHRARWCSAVCQSRNFRAAKKQTQAELEQEFLAQEAKQVNKKEAA